MKWFKHHSDASMNDKIGKLEDKFGLVGYAAYFKVLEMCALNWDEVSTPEFSFSLKQIQNKLRMKSKQTEFILTLLSELNLFQIFISDNEVIIKAPKLAEIKKRTQKKNQIETFEKPNKSTPNKKKNKEKEEEEEAETKTSTPAKIETSSQVDTEEIWKTVQFRCGYPREVFDEVVSDAELIFLTQPEETRNWKRFLSHYLKNEKQKIQESVLKMGKRKEQDEEYQAALARL